MEVLGAPVQSDQNLGQSKYCHILCDCHPVLALCGAYKPVWCGIQLVAPINSEDLCPVCNKRYCPDCNDYIFSCPRCGE